MPIDYNPNTDLPVGVVGTGLSRIHNDYAYPGRVMPPMVGSLATFGSAANLGLIRGWLYPLTVNAQYAAAKLSGADQEELDALIKEQMEADAAMRQAFQSRFEELSVGATSDLAIANAYDQALQYVAVGYNQPSALSQDIRATPRYINWNEGKQFQFNPSAVEFSFSMQGIAPTETTQQGGTASFSAANAGTTNLDLIFDRTLEVAAATRGQEKLGGRPIDKYFSDVGVQKDIWDCFRIILGGGENYMDVVGEQLGNVAEQGAEVKEGSVTDMVGRMFDQALLGVAAFTRPVAIYLNANFVVIGWVESLGVSYVQFNANFVPTVAAMNLGLRFYAVDSKAAVDPTLEEDEEEEETADGATTETSTVTRGASAANVAATPV